MEQLKGYKYRFYPTEDQEILLSKIFGSTRYIYNQYITWEQEYYKTTKKFFNRAQGSKKLTDLKKTEEYSWLKEVPSTPLQQAIIHAEKAFKRFFKKISGFPKHKKKNAYQSASFMSGNFKYIEKDHNLILTGLGKLNIRWSRFPKSNPTSITITKNRSGKYFVTLIVKEDIQRLPKTGQAVGIDLGLHDLIILSNDYYIENPRFLRKALHKLKFLQRSMNRKKPGSNRRDKTKKKLSRVHEKVASCRRDLAHKITTILVKYFDIIGIEDLNVKGMLKNNKLALSISDVGWGTIKQFLEYKCKWYGKNLVKIDRFFPSSKMCNNCKHVNQDLKFEDRCWICPNCGELLDRDLNAARNILEESLKQLKLLQSSGHGEAGRLVSTSETAKVRGEDVSFSEHMFPEQSFMKRKPIELTLL